MKSLLFTSLLHISLLSMFLSACAPVETHVPPPTEDLTQNPMPTGESPMMKEPLITSMYTADPSAHVFEGRLYIYPSHDLDHDNPDTGTNEGDQFNMEDYHVFSMENTQSPLVDHGQVLHVKDVPWASMQMWAPDAAFKDGTYYLYFPARDRDHIFRIGVATSKSPAGPFMAESNYMQGSFSIDPAVFIDDDGQAYMYFGGLWGGQLEKWQTGEFDPDAVEPIATQPALGPRVAKLSADMLGFDGPIGEIAITDEDGQPITAGDHSRRFFEASWVHKYNGLYYLSYSTGDTHYIAYATSESPTGPFVFRGYILFPVIGWTTHHSILEFDGKWYLFYHDSSLSGGVTHKRSMKFTELFYNPDGTIKPIDP